MSFMWGVGTVLLVANMGVRQAVGARTYTDAIKSVKQSELDLTAFKNFASLTPSSGGKNGVKLLVLGYATDGGNSASITYSPPPAPNRIPVDRATLDTHMYHYQVIASYDVSPIFNFNGVPMFAGVPGLGSPVPVSYSATAAVEHPEGLND